MANYLTTDTELTSIADAIRTKGGTNAALTYPTGFVSAINDIPTGGGTISLVLSGDQGYCMRYGFGKYLMENYRNNFTISTSNLTNLIQAFGFLQVSQLGFDLNIGSNLTITSAFTQSSITSVPNFNWGNGLWGPADLCFGVFNNCAQLTNIPNILDGADLTTFHNGTSNYNTWFSDCYKLETISSDLLSELYNRSTGMQCIRQMFENCYSLKKIENFGAFHPTLVRTSNMFYNSGNYVFGYLSSCSTITFAANGAARSYSNQSIDLTHSVGWTNQQWIIDSYNVTGGTTLADSVYNHDSAVATINSLPDCSAVSPASNPNNTIIFAAGSGANTSGGDISNLTSAELAVATAKGWNVVIQ